MMAYNAVPDSGFPCRRKYPDDPTKNAYEAAKSGDAVLLSEVLQELDASKRAWLLGSLSFGHSTSLLVAAEHGHLDCVKVLLKYKADVGSGSDDDDDDDDDDEDDDDDDDEDDEDEDDNDDDNDDDDDVAGRDENCILLMKASEYGHVNVVSFLVEQGANVDFQDKEGNTALMLASKNGHMNVVTFLVECGANINLQDKNGKSPLMIASDYRCVNIETFLIEQGAAVDLQDKDGKTALHHAIKNDSCWHGDVIRRRNFKSVFETVKCLINNGANVNATTNDNCTPLMIASIECDVKVIDFLVKLGANVDLQDKDGRTALHHALNRNSEAVFETVRSLIKYGANVNATTSGNCTPLMIAVCKEDDVKVIDLLIKHGANVDIQDEKGQSALFHAVLSFKFKTVKCLIKNGADVNVSTNDNCTPLMLASEYGQLDIVTFLIEHGANMDLQDKNGDTALHYAVRPRDPFYMCHDPCEVVDTLLTCGAAQLYNNQQFTPLLLASNKGMDLMVEIFIKIPEYTKEQRIDALELLGATLVACAVNVYGRPDTEPLKLGIEYIKHGMKERFQDPSHLLLKQPMEPIEAYGNRKESQTLEELARIEHTYAIIMEGLIIRERILGTDNPELLGEIRHVADYYEYRDSYKHKCIALYRHAMKIAQHCNQSVTSDLNHLTSVLYEKGWWNVRPRQKDLVLELLEQTVLEYEKEQRLGNDFRLQSLFTSLIQLVQIIAKFKHLEESKTSRVSVLLTKLFRLNPQDGSKNTLLHKAVEYVKRSKSCFAFELRTPRPLYKFPCISTVKLLLNAGINVDAFNKDGDTPLHKAVKYKPSSNKIHRLTDMLEALLDGGAHHDYVNNAGKTAMDLAKTDEARRILSDKRKLELKCISARAVKKFGLPYLGVVPKTLEKYIGMH